MLQDARRISFQQSQKQSALLKEGQKLTEVREMSRH